MDSKIPDGCHLCGGQGVLCTFMAHYLHGRHNTVPPNVLWQPDSAASAAAEKTQQPLLLMPRPPAAAGSVPVLVRASPFCHAAADAVYEALHRVQTQGSMAGSKLRVQTQQQHGSVHDRGVF